MEENKKYDEWREERERKRILQEELQVELNDETRYKIKDVCFICGIRIKNCFSYFVKYGNCCVVCSGRATRMTRIPGNEMLRGYETEELHRRRDDVKNGILEEQDASYYT